MNPSDENKIDQGNQNKDVKTHNETDINSNSESKDKKIENETTDEDSNNFKSSKQVTSDESSSLVDEAEIKNNLKDDQKSGQALTAENSQISKVVQLNSGGNIENSTIAGGNVYITTINANKENVQGIYYSEINDDKESSKIIFQEKLSLIPLPHIQIQKIKAVFVPSLDYSQISKKLNQNNRIFIIHGKEHAGKFTCSVHLGMQLPQKGEKESLNFYVYNRTIRDSLRLLDFVQHPEFEKNTLCIIEDAFENGINKIELSNPYLFQLEKILADKEAYLILTTMLKTSELVDVEVEKISAHVEEIPLVFQKHLDFYSHNLTSYSLKNYISERLIELCHKEKEKIGEHFNQPFQIDRFFQELKKLPSEASIDELLEITNSIKLMNQENPHTWFNGLSQNAKLYAMLIVLFEGVNRTFLNDIYFDSVQYLRDKGISNLEDSRERGLNDLLDEIRAQEDNSNFVSFDNKSFEEEVRRQIFNYHHLLWSLIGMLIRLIENFKDREYWVLRKVLGIAIGRLGIYQKYKLLPELEVLAKNEHGGVVAVVGYALDEICQSEPEFYPFVTTLLKSWVESGEPDFMWAVASSVWRLYDGLAFISKANNENSKKASDTLEKIFLIFKKLAETFDQFSQRGKYIAFINALENVEKSEQNESITYEEFIEKISIINEEIAHFMQVQLDQWAESNLRAILHAIRQIAWNYPQDMVNQIVKWLDADKDNNLYLVGRMAGYQLFHQYTHFEVQLIDERHLSLLDLVRPLLSTDEDTINMMFNTLLTWLQRQGWSKIIHEKLLFILNRLSSDELIAFRKAVSNQWLNSDSSEVRHISKSLIARSYILDGVPMFMPGNQYGVIVYDTSNDARANKVAHIVHRLYEQFDPQIDIYVLGLGEIKTVANPQLTLMTRDFYVEHSRPRIVYPPIENFISANTLFILILTWGDIYDLSDIQVEKYSCQFIIASAEYEPQKLKNIPVVSVKRQILEPDLNSIEKVVREHLAKSISAIKYEEWWKTLQEYFETELTDGEEIYSKLNNWIKKFDSIEYAQQPGDIARKIICTILWLASKDMIHCIEIVKGWLSCSDELSKLVGFTCGKTLFRVFAHCKPIPSVETHAVMLEIATLLINKQNSSGIEAVFYAARRWAENPEWSKRLLSGLKGSSGELIQIIETVLPDQYGEMIGIINNWTKPLESDKQKSLSNSVITLLEQIQLAITINMRQPLPTLRKGQMYGLIVIDTSAQNISERAIFAEATSRVLIRLQKDNHKKLDLMVYHLGNNYPVMFPNQEPTTEELLAQNFMRPRLLCPLFESYPLENIAFVLIFTNNRIIDQSDWIDTHWNEHIMIYSQRQELSWSKLFTKIPMQSTLEDIEEIIVRFIEKKIGE